MRDTPENVECEENSAFIKRLGTDAETNPHKTCRALEVMKRVLLIKLKENRGSGSVTSSIFRGDLPNSFKAFQGVCSDNLLIKEVAQEPLVDIES